MALFYLVVDDGPVRPVGRDGLETVALVVELLAAAATELFHDLYR